MSKYRFLVIFLIVAFSCLEVLQWSDNSVEIYKKCLDSKGYNSVNLVKDSRWGEQRRLMKIEQRCK